jgi:hypothetical protein
MTFLKLHILYDQVGRKSFSGNEIALTDEVEDHREPGTKI